MKATWAREDCVQAHKHAKAGQKQEGALNDPGPDRGNRGTIGSKREIDGCLGSVGAQNGERHGLAGPAAPQFIEKDVGTGKRAAIDVYNSITYLEASCRCLRHDKRDCDCGVAGATSSLYGLWHCKPN